MENEKVLTDHEIQYIVNSLPDGEWTAKERMMRDIGVGMGLKIARDKGYISPPTLNIGMGEIKESEVLKCCEDYADNYPIEGRITVNRTAMRKAPEVFLIAHTKSVTVESIVKLAEEWDAYCVVTPTDPDGIKDFRSRLLKLIQE